MATDQDAVRDYDTRYEEAYRCWNSFFPEAERDLRHYLGDQWDEAEKKALLKEGRNAFVFNRIRPVINLITGYQRKNRLSSIVSPVEKSDQKTADQLSQLLLYAFQNGDAYRQISDCFGGAVKTGWNLASVYVDHTDDPIDGDIRYSREPWNGFLLDPYFTRLDLGDCGYVLRRKFLNPEQVSSMLPGQGKDIRRLEKSGWERDDKFTWLPYQRQPGGPVQLAYDEFYEQKFEKQLVIVDMESGRYQDWKGDKEMFARLKAMNDAFELVERQKRVIKLSIIVNNELMRQETNPDGLDEYPFVPFVAVFEPESSEWSLKVQSLVRCMVDPQKESNKRRSQMIDILDSQINSGWLATEGSVINPRSLFQASQGKVIWKNQDSVPGAVEKIPPAQIPPSMFQLQQQFDSDIKEIAGVNDAAFGQMESGNESGVMMMLRQGAALTNLQDVFDNLRFSQKSLSQKTLKLIQQWSPNKLKRILNEDPTEQLANQATVKYDCSVQEGVLTDSQRQIYFRQLVDLVQLGVQIPPLSLLKAAPLQGKGELLEDVEEMLQSQQQESQRQQQVQNSLIEAQTNLATSKSMEQIAGAKERFTRASANMGLEAERTSEAVQNRNQAVLDQVRAMKELDSMQLRNIKEALMITEMLNQRDDAQAQEIRQQDIEISSIAEQLQQGGQRFGAEAPGLQPQQGNQNVQG